MTKEILLKIIEYAGSFWYIFDSYCPSMHCPTLLWFKEAHASDVDQFDDLINNCFIHIDCESGKLILVPNVPNKYIDSDYHIEQLYHISIKGVCINYSPADAQEIMNMQ